MIIAKCIINDLRDISPDAVKIRMKQSINIDGEIQELVLGQTYAVLAIERNMDGGVVIYINTDHESYCPIPFPAELFTFLSKSIPQDWCLDFAMTQGNLVIRRISFPEWVNDDHFYEKLVDEERDTVEVYKRRRLEIEG